MGKTQGHGVGDLHIFRRMDEVTESDGAAVFSLKVYCEGWRFAEACKEQEA